MNREKFIKKLNDALVDANIKDVQSIIDKYERHFDLAAEAGMSEKEAIDKFGDIEDIVNKYKFENTNNNSETNNQSLNYELTINSAICEKLDFVKTNKLGLTIEISENLKNNLVIDSDGRIIHIRDQRKIIKKQMGYIKVYVGPNVYFNELRVSVVTTDCKIEAINGSFFSMSSVSGDFKIDKLNFEDCKISTISGDILVYTFQSLDLHLSTISGDVVFNYCNIDNLVLSTISGDVKMTGKINNRKCSNISGNINFRLSN